MVWWQNTQTAVRLDVSNKARLTAVAIRKWMYPNAITPIIMYGSFLAEDTIEI